MACLGPTAARHLLLRLVAAAPPSACSFPLATLWSTFCTTTAHRQPQAPLPTQCTQPRGPWSLHTAALATAARAPPSSGPASPRRTPSGKPVRPGAGPPVQHRPHNQQITAPEVRVVLPSGETRVMDTPSALRLAREQHLDLVEMTSSQVPPVCRLMDYREYLEASRTKAAAVARDAAERQAAEARVPQKEVQFSVRIADHDLEIKLKRVLEFLQGGRKVLLVVKFKGSGEQQAADQAMGYLLATIRQRASITASTITKGQYGLNCTVRQAAS